VHKVKLQVVGEEREEVRRRIELGREALAGEMACQLCEEPREVCVGVGE
jgi:hypothetical protein